MESAIKAENLTKRYTSKNRAPAIEDVSFAIPQGILYGLVGPDGAGKTTIMRILSSVMNTTSGNAWVGGFNVRNQAEEVRRHLGYMPQNFSLYPDLNIMENLNFFADIQHVPAAEKQQRIEEMLSITQLEKFTKRRAGNLSGGMKKKLALACAMVHNPRVLILDEPSTGVDPVSRRELWVLLARVVQNGVTVLVSTPYMDEASLCDRIALIQKGKILKIDTPENIINNYEKVIYDVQAKNTHGLIHDLKNYPNQYSVYAFGEFVHYIDKNATFNPNDLQTYLKNKNHTDIIIKPATITIEEVFMDL